MKIAVAAVVVVVLSCSAAAPPTPTPSTPSAPAAKPADVKSIDSILAALYDVISGPAGQKRDWDRFRSLFLPGARLIPTSATKEGGYAARVLSPDEYVGRAEPFFAKEAFFEKEAARRVDQWAQIAQVFSTYESRHAPSEQPFAKGINSIQLLNDGQRWWLVTIFWEAESKDNPLPESMLHSPKR